MARGSFWRPVPNIQQRKMLPGIYEGCFSISFFWKQCFRLFWVNYSKNQTAFMYTINFPSRNIVLIFKRRVWNLLTESRHSYLRLQYPHSEWSRHIVLSVSELINALEYLRVKSWLWWKVAKKDTGKCLMLHWKSIKKTYHSFDRSIKFCGLSVKNVPTEQWLIYLNRTYDYHVWTFASSNFQCWILATGFR